MKDSIHKKLEGIAERHEELAGLLADPDVIGNQDQFRKLSVEYSQLEEVVKTFQRWRRTQDDIASAKDMLGEDDAEMRAMAQDELDSATEQAETLETALQKLLLPKDPHDDSNVFLEIRAGTGGDEAAIFAGDLFRMYAK